MTMSAGWWRSAGLFARKIGRRSWPIFAFCLLDFLDVYERMATYLPSSFPPALSVPMWLTVTILLLAVSWAATTAYHEERMRADSARQQVASRLNYAKVTLRELAAEGKQTFGHDFSNITPAIEEWLMRGWQFLDHAVSREYAGRFGMTAKQAAAHARERRDGTMPDIEISSYTLSVAANQLMKIAAALTEDDLRPELRVPDEYIERVNL